VHAGGWAHARLPLSCNADPASTTPSHECNERAKVAVNAQHYAILVTDVAQWPYPELQREYEASRLPSAGERLYTWLGRVPRAVSRPDVLFGPCMRGGAASSDDASVGAAPLLPLATRRSIELAQGAGICSEDLALLREPAHATDDLEAAVETIENARAKVGAAGFGLRLGALLSSL
jgi:hypothetical protein